VSAGPSPDLVHLLARNPGAIRADYTNRLDRAMRGEPEAIRTGELENIAAGKHLRRRTQVEQAKGRILQDLDQLAADAAGAAEYRRLQRLRDLAQNL
jgi:hypothetical protein